MSDLFQALADPTRRDLMDRLFASGGLTLTELCKGHRMSRQAISKHLLVLENAELIVTRRQGRHKLHYLNPMPLSKLFQRWIGKCQDIRLEALADFANEGGRIGRVGTTSNPPERRAEVR